MSDNIEYRSSGIGLPGALFIVFVTLKLTGTIDWSWWWVTAPLWLPTVIFIVCVCLYLIIAASLDVWDDRKRAKQRAVLAASRKSLPRKGK